MLSVVIVVISLAGLAYLWMKRKFSFWSDRGFLSPPTYIPFGSLKDGSSKNDYEELREIYEKFKGKTPALGIYMFLKPAIVPLDLELCKNILIRDFASFHDRDHYINKEDEPTSAK
jgi:cytochrome P450 family 6